ncbi:MAG: hypothetical protein JRF18_06130, partial [Deltaproteobacteria bacterium]|nr:hypothetical protein [Deltaproteobacteria bacterium]
MTVKEKSETDVIEISRRILRLVGEEWLRLLIAMLCMIAVAVLTAATAFVIKPVLDEIFFKKDMEMLKLLPWGILFLYLSRGVCY